MTPAYPLCHRLYSNALWSDGRQGYRSINLRTAWPPINERTVQDWELALVNPNAPRTDCNIGYAMRQFKGEREQQHYVCAAIVMPRFAQDGYQRGDNSLVHLLAVPTVEGEGAVPQLALVSHLRDLSLHRLEGFASTVRLDTYIQKYTGADQLLKRSLALEDIAGLDESVLTCVLQQVYLAACKRESPSGSVQLDGNMPHWDIAVASAALPPRLRLSFTWSCHLDPNRPGTAVFNRPDMEVKRRRPQLSKEDLQAFEHIAAFARAWLARRDAGDITVLQSLSGDWAIKSWPMLLEKGVDGAHPLASGTMHMAALYPSARSTQAPRVQHSSSIQPWWGHYYMAEERFSAFADKQLDSTSREYIADCLFAIEKGVEELVKQHNADLQQSIDEKISAKVAELGQLQQHIVQVHQHNAQHFNKQVAELSRLQQAAAQEHTNLLGWLQTINTTLKESGRIQLAPQPEDLRSTLNQNPSDQIEKPVQKNVRNLESHPQFRLIRDFLYKNLWSICIAIILFLAGIFVGMLWGGDTIWGRDTIPGSGQTPPQPQNTHQKTPAPPPPTIYESPPESTNTPAPQKTFKLISNNPLADWKRFLNEQPRMEITKLFRKIASGDGLEDGQVSNIQRGALSDLADKIDGLERNASLVDSMEDNRIIRDTLDRVFEYVMARNCAKPTIDCPQTVTVDLSYLDADANVINAYKSRLEGAYPQRSFVDSATDQDLRAAIAMLALSQDPTLRKVSAGP